MSEGNCPTWPSEQRVWASPAQWKQSLAEMPRNGSSRTPSVLGTVWAPPPVLRHVLRSRWATPLALQAGLHPALRMGTDTEGSPGAWRALCTSPPGEKSHLFFSQLEKSMSLFCASLFNEQETQQKLPPGHSGLKSDTHTSVGQVLAQLNDSTMPGNRRNSWQVLQVEREVQ